MDEEISIINSNTRLENIKNFFLHNKKKLIIILILIIIFIFSFFISKEINSNKKIEISNKYNEAILSFSNGNTQRAENILNYIIDENDNTYSPLALYFLIDNEIMISRELINSKFDKIINDLDLENEIKFLVIYKKALFNSDFATENELIDILSPITNSESIWKSHALYLLGEYFMSKNEKQKAKEFYEKILALSSGNNKIKSLTQKRFQNEFVEQ
tara:strand:- start:1471 stop:2118 length:648 start_codon:yes stop_codon:yes gene_type:complete